MLIFQESYISSCVYKYHCHTAAQHTSESNRDKPMPVPRKTQQAVEESIYDLPLLPDDPLHFKNDDTQQAYEYDLPRKLAFVCVMHDDYKRCNGIVGAK